MILRIRVMSSGLIHQNGVHFAPVLSWIRHYWSDISTRSWDIGHEDWRLQLVGAAIKDLFPLMEVKH